MSNISDIIDRLRVVIPALTGFNDKKELRNSYDLLDNPQIILKDAWGLTVETSVGAPLPVFNEHSEARNFGIIVTKQIFRLENDATTIHTATKGLLEDMVTVNTELLKSNQLAIGDKIRKIDFVTNAGLQFIKKDKTGFLFTETVFSIQITETI